MSVLIFTGGQAPLVSVIDWKIDYIIVADAGLDTCKAWKMRPDLILGDFDSVSKETAISYAPRATIIEYPSDKNFSDTYLALEYAHSLKDNDITLIGGHGGRLDHFIEILKLFSSSLSPNRIIGNEYQLERIYDQCKIDCSRILDKYISFFALSLSTKQKSRGLKWNLDDLILDTNFSSLSNEFTSEYITIKMIEGILLGIWKYKLYAQRTY